MKNYQKILLIFSAIAALDWYFGFDARFTIINLIWCVPILIEMMKKK